MTWIIKDYPRTEDPSALTEGDKPFSWTEYAIDDDEGRPVCTGIVMRSIAEEIVDAHKRRSPQAAIDRLGILGEEVLAELRHIRSQAGERISSATVKTSTRGTDLEVHSYDDGRLGAAVDDAIAEYARGLRELQRLQATNWDETVDGLRERVAEGSGDL